MSNLSRLFEYVENAPMLFNSGAFLVLFTVFITIYALIYKNASARIVYVVTFSLFFYYKASGWYLLILLLSIVLDYLVAFLIYNAKAQIIKKAWLTLSVCANVGLLCYFKYTNFFIENLNAATGANYNLINIFLPIGISFYTFQTLSYIIDVYRGIIKPTRSLLDYTFYMSFFPHLVAGPIVRAKDFLPQVRQNIILNKEDMSSGMFLIIKGLIKKAIIADYIAQYADLIYSNPAGYSGFENLMAMYGYALQIYCDFSGYSDMAIGIARLMGYDLGTNFKTPYISKNTTEFWRRWHISLSSWLRDYIYIPLGGNRKGEFNQYLFLFATMLIGGFWHGASWKFVVWGAAHGIGLAIHKLFMKYAGNKLKESWWRNALGWFITFHFVAVLWIFFRAESFSVAMESINMILFHLDFSYAAPFVQVRSLFVVLLLIGYGLQFLPENMKLISQKKYTALPLIAKAAVLILIIQVILQIQLENVQPFIYFQF